MNLRIAVLALTLGSSSRGAASPGILIVTSPDASPTEVLAAREVRRYLYLRTGDLAALSSAPIPSSGRVIVVARADRPLASGAAAGPLGAQQYALKCDGNRAWIVGGDDVGTLYGAYRFAEGLGVRFYLHGDVVPDRRLQPGPLPRMDEKGVPLFETRGLQPFHDFPEGPDWWNRDDYLATIAQLPKMRMNFIGFHTYPEGEVGPEAEVWIGLPSDMDREGNVAFSYPSWWASTARDGPWAFRAIPTSEFTGGAALFFPEDTYGPDVMAGMMPRPTMPAASNELFNRTGALFRDAFAEARSLGVRTCVGTETPLTIPTQVKERLRRMGRDPGDPAVVRELYEGIFRRIAAACPVDYYWLWTPESWTWESDKPGEFKATTRDIQAALAGLKAAGNPFTLAMCGWVLGPREDRAALDRLLPKECPISCINRKVGHAPDEPGFANITDRPKWVIPWLENDPSLVAPEPWVGRMRFDAVEGLRLGCTGLIGIHWRTKAIAANIAALAAAGWDQSWVPPGFDTSRIPAGAPVSDPGSNTAGLDHPRKGRGMPVGGFYEDYARANFGAGVAREAGAILAGIDGVKLPEPATWIKGPGDIRVNSEPWGKESAKYAFVGRLAALRAKVAGAGNLERFDAVLNTYRAMEAMAEAGCARGELDRMAAAITAARDPAQAKALAGEALAVRIGLARIWERMMRCQVGATDTPGDMGTLSNLEQHSRVFMNFLGANDVALEKALGRPLPDSASPSREYEGPARIMLPTVRTLARRGEELRLRVIVLDAHPVASASLFFRAMGSGAYGEVPVTRVARAVYEATVPPLSDDTEYYIQARTAGGVSLRWPAAPGLTQTVVVR